MRTNFWTGLVVGIALSTATAAVAGNRLDGAWALLSAAQGETVALRSLVGQVPDRGLRRAMSDRLVALDGDLSGLAGLLAATPERPPVPPPAPVPVAPPVPSAIELASLIAAVEAAPFSEEKVATVRSIARDRAFTVEQVRQFVALVAFGDDKVEVAATLYPHVVDPWMWHEVYADLPFSSSREELRRRTQ